MLALEQDMVGRKVGWSAKAINEPSFKDTRMVSHETPGSYTMGTRVPG